MLILDDIYRCDSNWCCIFLLVNFFLVKHVGLTSYHISFGTRHDPVLAIK